MFLVLLVLSQVSLTSSVENNVWIGPLIIIKPDDGVEPLDAPVVTYDNVTYFITKNLVIDGYAQINIWKTTPYLMETTIS